MIVLLPKALGEETPRQAMTRKLPPDYALWEDVARTVKPLHKAKAKKKSPPKAEPLAPVVKAKSKSAEPAKPIARTAGAPARAAADHRPRPATGAAHDPAARSRSRRASTCMAPASNARMTGF